MRIKSDKGIIFITVLCISMLMILIAVSASNMLLQDAHMIKHLKRSTQAQYLAEAGINSALALLAVNFSAKDTPANFPQTALGEGTYDVTVIETGGRVLLSSEGVVNGVSRTAALEIRSNIPTALDYMMSAGNVLRLRAFFLGLADVNGNLHANNDVRLRAQALGFIDVDPCGGACCDGDVSAGDRVFLSEGFLGDIDIAGTVTEGAGMVTFPTFDYTLYQTEAIAGGDYHAGDADFGSDFGVPTLTPTNGIVYVEGTATIEGTCDLSGGLVADRIRVRGRLNQVAAGNRNVIIARGENTVGDIEVSFRLDAAEAIVYAQRDFSVASAGSFINVTGSLIASRNLSVWDFLSRVTYNHLQLSPEGLLGVGGETELFEIVSWNR